MLDHDTTHNATSRRRRADAERSIKRILDGATECLSIDPDASMTDIAREAGVVRATIYVHFPTREALIDAVTEAAVAEVAQVIASADPESGEPVEALKRVLSATWRTLGRYHNLVAINSQMAQEELHRRHAAALGALHPLIVRGQKTGVFRSDVPPTWHLATMLALIHGASGELSAGRIDNKQVEGALAATVVGALTGEATS